ncbi:leucine-rich repeat flightless-interacting protein 2 isoform X16 [Canis lupus baileyi]|uniref:Leucine-rich repeat flightless-interacting protein 2 n=1 Tax=Canis lupus familiaris TaxID=9615 RepID=A0A8C0SMN3_CANLF|nr:leucine-rich repeat flightless-interacting protein 2 isoform X14 [Canis lupus familiaris]XP_025317141.1 leucine-rich repeat flightless-interacting protein 2 isoform X18 [Canis lupus dingo]XP_038287766.1 leucine-rich repeat flightless-interacting protein 2 isoform X14 [Canis lupus familiaris]XP_038426318.1 leucine-rich repeat flightless-interacting protein 2 isoform X14 [Canis lupus familiaris]|eukprot:XP_005634301.1 leucine-rich repeat flightless-interacting protein 2 isoform X17 [Canis lupus familiaris]
MGTPGSGRKRTPVKDRFSAEDEALSNIAREAEARLAAKRAARAEARDIRMRELERQQKEHSHYSFDRKWGQIHKWLEDSERARYSHRSSHRRPYLGVEDALSIRSLGSHRNPSKDIIGTHWSRASTPKRKDIMYDPLKDRSSRLSSLDHSYSHSYGMKKRSSGSHKDPLSGLYFDQRNYSSLRHSKPTSAYYSRQSSSLCSDPLATSKSTRASFTANSCLLKSTSLVSLCDGGLYNPYGSRTPSEYSYYSSRISSARSSPVFADDDTASIASSGHASHGRRDSVVSTADYFSRSNRRGSVVSEVDDISIPDLTSLDEKSDKQYAENYTRPSSRNSASATTPLSGNSSRRGSGDTSSLVDPDTSLSELRDIYDLKDQIQDVEGRYMQGLKELKESLSEVEEKYKKAMVSNAQLDNEKNNLIYQVDTLKDVIEEQEEQMAEFYRENEEKSKELERQKHMCSVLQHKMDELKEGLRQRDELIEKHGLVIIPDGTPNGDVNHEPVVGAITVVSQEAAQVLESAGEGPLDVRLRKLAGEKEELLSQIRRLKLQLEEERQKCSRSENAAADLAGLHNGSDLQFIEMQRDANRQISEYKFKLSKAEQDITTLEQNISRLEGQVLRYKTAAENAEKVEDELKAEKRKLQRELRTALDKIEEMEMTNSHLAKRLEKMKANRTALLAQQ